MKKLISIVALVAFFGTIASAQEYGVKTLYTTNSATALVGGVALVTTGVIDCRKVDDVAVQFTAYPKTTAADVLTLCFIPSIDGVTYSTLENQIFILTPSGTAGTASTIATNFNTLGFGYWKLSYVTNAAAAAGVITNISVKHSIKMNVD